MPMTDTAPKIIAVVGPTGTGKSNLGLAIAQSLISHGQPAEIINTDSMQFYRGMDIGTAKLSEAERLGIPHHLIDHLEIRAESTAAEYQLLARERISALQTAGRVPILVGGSMLYIAAVLNQFDFPGTDEQLRSHLEERLLEVGSVALHRELADIDPTAAARVDPLNPRRVVRALEIVQLTGKPFAAALPEVPIEWQPALQIGLNSERAHLVQRLAERVHLMWETGLLEEVESLISLGLREAKTAGRAIGYAQALSEIDGKLTREEAIAQTVQLTQKYARRQMSWFRRDRRINWLDYQDPAVKDKALALVDDWLKS